MKSRQFNSEDEFLENWKPYFQKVADLQELLFSQDPNCDVNEFIEQIPKYFFQSKVQIIQLFSSIYSLHFSRVEHKDFCNKLFEILLPQFLQFLSKEEFVSMIEFQSKDLYLLFFNLGVIPIDHIIYKIKEYDDPYSFIYFHDIIEEQAKEVYDDLKSRYIGLFQSFDFRDFNNRRKIGKNDSPIALAIRDDDVKKCQTIISSLNIKKDYHIPYSIFETIEGVSQRSNIPSLLEYAAFFGSINCFKYLVMNDFIITPKLISFAIFGGNLEIIHICEGIHAPLELALRSSICCFRDDFFEYFQDSQDVKFTDSAICCSIRNYNINSLLNNLHRIYENPNICDDRGDYPIIIAATKDYVDIFYMLISSKKIDLNVSDINHNNSIFLSIEGHHNLIFDILIDNKEVDVNKVNILGENILTRIVEYNNTEFLIKALSRDDIITLNPQCIQNEIMTAINNKNIDLLRMLFDHEKYKEKAAKIEYFKFFVLSAAISEEWDIIDFLLSRCTQYLPLLKIVDLFFTRTDDEKEDVYKKLRKKIYKFSKRRK